MRKDAARTSFVAGYYAMAKDTHLMASPGDANDEFELWWAQFEQKFKNAMHQRPVRPKGRRPRRKRLRGSTVGLAEKAQAPGDIQW
jgi:hypothetical protein